MAKGQNWKETLPLALQVVTQLLWLSDKGRSAELPHLCQPAVNYTSSPQNIAYPWFPLFWHFPFSLVLTSLDCRLSYPHHPHRYSVGYPTQAFVPPPNQSSMHSSGQQESSQSSSDLSSAPLLTLSLSVPPLAHRGNSDHGLTPAFPCLGWGGERERTPSLFCGRQEFAAISHFLAPQSQERGSVTH